MHRRQLVDYVSLAVIWGVSFVLVLHAVGAFGWAATVAFRSLIASGILLVLSVATGRRLQFRSSWRALAVVGATTVAGQLAGQAYASPRIGTAMVAIFVGAIPLFSMLIGRAWGLERITAWGRVGLLAGFGGMVLLVGFPSVPVTPEFVAGCAVALAASVSAAFGSNYARRTLRPVSSWEQSIGAFLFGGLLMLPLVTVVPIPAPPSLVDVALLVLLAGVCSSLAYVLYFRLVAEVGATTAISVEFLVTVIAVAIGSIWLREQLSAVQLIGGAVIIAGCATVVGILPRRETRSSAPDAPRGGVA